MGMVVHGADLGNPAYPSFEMTKVWCFRVCEEFSNQATMEKELGLPVTAFMEGLNNEVNIAKLQVGFVNYVILPLWHCIAILIPKSAHMVKNCVSNVETWQEIIEKGNEGGGKDVDSSSSEEETDEEE